MLDLDRGRAGDDGVIRHFRGFVRRFGRGEVLPWPERRRRWSWKEKAQIVAESLAPHAVASAIARRYGLHRNQLYAWRKELRGRSGAAGGRAADAESAGMIVPPSGVRVLVATLAGRLSSWRPTVLRRSYRRCCGTTRSPGRFTFFAANAPTVKLVVRDGSGLVLLWKRLESGVFRWPPVTDGVMRLSAAQLAALLDGLDWSRMHVPRLGRPKTAQ